MLAYATACFPVQYSASSKESPSNQISSDSDSEGDGKSTANTTRKKRRTNFIETLYTMTILSENEKAIGFTSDGLYLEIRDADELGLVILPRYFKHRNISSFIRQLNNYGFRTVPSSKGTFQTFIHENFIRDKQDLLRFIVRKTVGDSKKKKSLYEQLEDLKTSHEESILRIQELEGRELSYNNYIKQMELSYRALLNEREGLILDNQRLRKELEKDVVHPAVSLSRRGGSSHPTYNGMSTPTTTLPQQSPQSWSLFDSVLNNNKSEHEADWDPKLG